MPYFAELGLGIDSSQAKKAAKELDGLSKSSDRAEKSADIFTATAKRTAVAMAGLAASAFSLRGAIAVTEKYTGMSNRLVALGASHAEAADQIQRLADIANGTRAPLEATAQLYTRLSLSADSLGASQAELFDFTKTVGLALAASGTSASEASGALLQLSQAMAGGVVRAEEFNSIIEGAPGLLMAVSNGIQGVDGDLGKLRAMMLKGVLTSREFFNSLLSQSGALETAFGKTVLTIGQAFTVLTNNITTAIGTFDQATGVSETLAMGILLVAENIDYLAIALGWVAASLLPAAISGVISLGGALATAATGAGALGVVMGAALGPFGILAGLVGAAATALIVLNDNSKEAEKGISEAEKASIRLNEELAVFYEVAQPSASDSIIALANDNYKLAASAYDAAKAELAKTKAILASEQAIHQRNIEMEHLAPWITQQRINDAQRDYKDALDLVTEAQRDLDRATAETRVAVTATTTELQKSKGVIDVTVNATDELSKALSGGGGASKAFEDAATEAEAFNQALIDASLTAEDFGQAKAQIMIGGVDSIANAWGDFVMRGFSNFKEFAGSVLDTFKNMLKQMIAMAARNQIMFSAGFNVSGGGGALSGASSLFGDIFGAGSFIGNALGTAGALFSTVTANVLSGIQALTSGLGTFTSMVSSTVAGLSGSGIFGAASLFGQLIPAIGLLAGAVKFISSAFSRKYGGSGIRGQWDQETGAFIGSTFDFYKGGAFKSNKTDYDFESEGAKLLNDTVKGIKKSIRWASRQLGLEAEKMKEYVGEMFTVWVNGKSEEEIAKELEKEFGKISDGMAELVIGSRKWVKEGESHYDALMRLATSLVTANNTLKLLNGTLYDMSVKGARAAERFVEAFGGIEGMLEATNEYIELFYSDAEKQRMLRQSLRKEFRKLDLEVPKTTDGFRDLTEKLLQGGNKSKLLAAELIKLSEAFYELNGAKEALAAEKELEIAAERKNLRLQLLALLGKETKLRQIELRALDPANRELQKRIWALQDERDAISKTFGALEDAIGAKIERVTARATRQLDRLNSTLDKAQGKVDRARDAISGFIDDIEENTVNKFSRMRDAAQSALEGRTAFTSGQAMSVYQSAQNDLRRIAKRLSTGKSVSESVLNAAISGLSGAGREQFGSLQEYLLDAAKTNESLRTISAQADSQMSDAEAQVELLRKTYGIQEEGFKNIEAAIKSLEKNEALVSQTEREIKALENWRDSQVKQLEKQLEADREQTNALLGIKDGVMSVEKAMRDFTSLVGVSFTWKKGVLSDGIPTPVGANANAAPQSAKANGGNNWKMQLIDEVKQLRKERAQDAALLVKLSKDTADNTERAVRVGVKAL